VLALLIGAACTESASSDGSPAPEPPGAAATEAAPGVDAERTTLRVALLHDPRSLDPREVLDAEGELVVRAIFDGLVDVAPDGRIVPASAKEWSVEDDGLT
jgi:ABC-type oligopeptide transport system substrate-binding subunit